MLGKKGIYYSNASTLEKTLIDFDRNWSKKQNWDCYSALFSPENVMPLFEKNLIQTALKNGTKHPYKADFTIIDKIICKLKLKSI